MWSYNELYSAHISITQHPLLMISSLVRIFAFNQYNINYLYKTQQITYNLTEFPIENNFPQRVPQKSIVFTFSPASPLVKRGKLQSNHLFLTPGTCFSMHELRPLQVLLLHPLCVQSTTLLIQLPHCLEHPKPTNFPMIYQIK